MTRNICGIPGKIIKIYHPIILEIYFPSESHYQNRFFLGTHCAIPTSPSHEVLSSVACGALGAAGRKVIVASSLTRRLRGQGQFPVDFMCFFGNRIGIIGLI